MDFDYSTEQDAFRKVVRDFAEAEIAPHAEAWDRDHHFPVDVVHKMGDLGLFGLVAPVEYGGAAAEFTTLCIAIEELGRVDQSMGITLSAGVGLGINPILTYGSAEQKARFLPDLVAGRTLGAFGLTEPDGGSDAGATRTRAERRDGQYVINGEKAFITTFTGKQVRENASPDQPRLRRRDYVMKRKGYLIRWIETTPEETNPAVEAVLKKAREALTWI